MRAVALHAVPAAPEITDLPTPKPDAGEVLVRVAAASVNGFDVATTAGMLQGMMEHRFPLVLGKDFAGIVEAVGDPTSRLAAGDAVFGVVMKPFLGTGSLAEYVTVSEAHGITTVPDGVSLSDAGALGLAGTAALNAIEALALSDGEPVLIVGATGGVGAIAVQYAAAAGAHVIATARPGTESGFVRELGASDVVDYTGDLAAQVRAIAPDGVPAALHLAGDGAQVADLLAPGGRLASTLGFGPEALAGRKATATAVMANPDPATLGRLAADVAAGRVRVPVTHAYPLQQAPQALRDFADGALGKLAITVP
jgi:NADPH:quinone reductase-like Zn-dependent oxidoreductase